MKTLFFSFISLVLITSCEPSEQPRFTYETIMIDLTDEDDSIGSDLLEDYGHLSGNDGMCLSLVYITDVHHNPKHTLCIDSFTNGINDNVLDRNRQVRNFNLERDSLFSEVDSMSLGNGASHIVKAVCRELTVFSALPEGNTKRLVLFSNLFENSPFFSIYKNHDVKRLDDPEQLALELENELVIPDRLDGITIEIRYQPRSETEVLHDQMIDLYRHLFEGRGCTIKTHIEHIKNIK